MGEPASRLVYVVGTWPPPCSCKCEVFVAMLAVNLSQFLEVTLQSPSHFRASIVDRFASKSAVNPA